MQRRRLSDARTAFGQSLPNYMVPSPMGLTSPLFPSARLPRPCSRGSQNPLSRAATPEPGGRRTREGGARVCSPKVLEWSSTSSSSRPWSPSSWPSIYDHGSGALGAPFCSPRAEMDVKFGLYTKPPLSSASDIARRAQICTAYGGRALPTGVGPSASDVNSARKLVRSYKAKESDPQQQRIPRPVRKLVRALGASASLERLGKPLDVVGSIRWAEAMGRDAKLLLELKKLAVAEQATATQSKPRPAPLRSRASSFTTLRSRTPREDTSREFDSRVDARWWDDSMVSRTVRLIPEKHYGSRVPVDPDGDAD